MRRLLFVVALCAAAPIAAFDIGACGSPPATYASCVYTAMPLVDASCGMAAAVQGDLGKCGLVSAGAQPAAVCLANCTSDAGCTYAPEAGTAIGGLLCDCH